MLAKVAKVGWRGFETLRAAEYRRLDEVDIAYLDYAASGIHSKSQADDYAGSLYTEVLGNPHSEHSPSRESENALTHARAATLDYFNADASEYDVCFAANTSAAIKLVAESYRFAPDRCLILSADNHNSINGIREYARRQAALTQILPLDAELRLQVVNFQTDRVLFRSGGLFAFPAQSNFSGVQHDLDLIVRAQEAGYQVLLDAAAMSIGSRIDLRRHPADFLALSFYKLFGLPTGLGALVAKKSALAGLRRPWFAGGTVDYVSVLHDRHQLRLGHEGFEDGTPNFLSANAVVSGFSFISEIDRAQVHERMDFLTAYLLSGLERLTHNNGAPIVRVYGPRNLHRRGPTIAFNILDREGTVVPYPVIEARARDAGVALRGGCFCNPGAAESAFGFGSAGVADIFDRLGQKFTIAEFQRHLGKGSTVGALRISLGLPTSIRDLDRALELVHGCANLEAQSLE